MAKKSRNRVAAELFCDHYKGRDVATLVKEIEELLKHSQARNSKGTPEWMPLPACRDLWNNHHREGCGGIKPRWNLHTPALIGILTQFKDIIDKSNHGLSPEEIREIIEEKFRKWLELRPEWPKFFQDKYDLTKLNKSFADIIFHLRNGRKGIDKDKFRDGVDAAVERRFGTKVPGSSQ